MPGYLSSEKFRKTQEKLEHALFLYGSVEWDEGGSDEETLAYNVRLEVESNDPALYCIEIYVTFNGEFKLEKKGISFFVEELDEVQKVLSIFYGSPFSLTFEPIDVLWPRYHVCILKEKLKTVEELKEHVHILKLLLTKVSRMLMLS